MPWSNALERPELAEWTQRCIETGVIPENMKHIGQAELERYSAGEMRGCRLIPVEEHLLICEICMERLAGIDESSTRSPQTGPFGHVS